MRRVQSMYMPETRGDTLVDEKQKVRDIHTDSGGTDSVTPMFIGPRMLLGVVWLVPFLSRVAGTSGQEHLSFARF